MNHKNFLIFSIGLLLTVLASCGAETETHTVNSPELQLRAEGPLFEGANTATASWEFDLVELVGRTQEGQVNVRSARLTQLEIILQEGDNLPGIQNMVFEMTSKNNPMTRLALYEGRIEPGQVIALNVASQQEKLATAFQDGKITFVGDFDLLEEEYWDDIQFMLRATFELEVKQ